jgi:hypothetical protein
MFKQLGAALYLRRIAKDLSLLVQAMQRQDALLLRLADHFAPNIPPEDRQTVRSDTGVSHLDPLEAQIVGDYIARTERQTGHTPDDEEILIYLADEKTTDLHSRLVQRERDLERLAESRR